MSSKPLMIEGIVRESSEHDEEIRQLRRENQKLDEALRGVRNELGQVRAEKESLERSIRALRNQLSPLHRALRSLFGEIELAVGEDLPSTTTVSGTPPEIRVSGDPRWESYKQNFPGAPARIIDALLSHREMTITQLANLLKMDYSTAKGACQKLKAAGAIRREGKGPASLNV